MPEFLRRIRRSSLPPSVDAFDARMSDLETRIGEIASTLDRQAMGSEAGSSDQDLVLDVLSLLHPVRASRHEKKRFGSAGDGGYVMLDDLARVGSALSFGIDVNDDWDLQVAQAGIEVRQFDHSIERAPSTHPRLRFECRKVGVAASADMVTLPDLLREAEGRVLLKIDIEGHEWPVFEHATSDELSRCTQICCEFHNLSKLRERSQALLYRTVLAKMNVTHAVVHVHANNYGGLHNVCNVPVPDVLEVTFAARHDFTFEPSGELFPGPLDVPNRPSHPDIFLGAFVFRPAATQT